ncbi:MAG: T9SS type A sorting domain-containing protein, partial [Ignavibacteriaceae bacterium]
IGASTSKVLPIGISTVYTPVTITNNNVSTDNFSALVSSDASGSNSGADRVKLLWTIGRAGSSNYTPAFTWPSSVEGATFSANRATYAQLYDVNNTSSSIASTLSGSDPYTVTANTFASSNTSYTIGNNAAALPVELTSFFALVQNKTVSLAWQTATEVNNYGFEIERTSSRPSPLQGEGGEAGRGWVKVGFVNGAGNSNSPKEYSFTDKTATSGLNVYRLKQIDNDGKYTYSKEVEVDLGMPTEFSLAQNYPNPFNPTTSLQYAVSSKQLVTIKVFDMLGREVAVLVNGEKEPGTYTAEFSTTGLASGTYLYRMQAGGFVQTKKMVVLK